MFTEHGNFADSLVRALYATNSSGAYTHPSGASDRTYMHATVHSDEALRDTIRACGLDNDEYVSRLTLERIAVSGSTEPRSRVDALVDFRLLYSEL